MSAILVQYLGQELMIQIKNEWSFNEKTEMCVRNWEDKTELKELKVLTPGSWMVGTKGSPEGVQVYYKLFRNNYLFNLFACKH